MGLTKSSTYFTHFTLPFLQLAIMRGAQRCILSIVSDKRRARRRKTQLTVLNGREPRRIR
jgi:hypothetical protein